MASFFQCGYWELYYIVNEQNGTIAKLWGGYNLKCTFRRTVDRRLLTSGKKC
jgi:hypothetical protein